MTTIIAAGGLVLNEHEEILMIFRRNKWDLPKGKLDDGETIEQCAIREVEEETGLTNLVLGHFLLNTQHQYFDTWINQEVLKETYWYVMQAQSWQQLTPQTTEDIEKIEWVNAQNRPEKLANTYQNIVEVLAVYENLKT